MIPIQISSWLMQNGDIGNTSSMYAKAFEDLNFDSVTVAPYMEKIQ
jgi:orotidine-5'-phosphate decarboxylase